MKTFLRTLSRSNPFDRTERERKVFDLCSSLSTLSLRRFAPSIDRVAQWSASLEIVQRLTFLEFESLELEVSKRYEKLEETSRKWRAEKFSNDLL